MELLEQSEGGALLQVTKEDLGILTHSLLYVGQTLSDEDCEARLGCRFLDAQRLLAKLSPIYEAQKVI